MWPLQVIIISRLSKHDHPGDFLSRRHALRVRELIQYFLLFAGICQRGLDLFFMDLDFCLRSRELHSFNSNLLSLCNCHSNLYEESLLFLLLGTGAQSPLHLIVKTFYTGVFLSGRLSDLVCQRGWSRQFTVLELAFLAFLFGQERVLASRHLLALMF